MGGASSHDKEYRTESVSWWQEELPCQDEYETAKQNLEAVNWKVDYVISHCCSSSIQRLISNEYKPDELTEFFEMVEQRLSYNHWYCGHYHMDLHVDAKHTCLYQSIMIIGFNDIVGGSTRQSEGICFTMDGHMKRGNIVKINKEDIPLTYDIFCLNDQNLYKHCPFDIVTKFVEDKFEVYMDEYFDTTKAKKVASFNSLRDAMNYVLHASIKDKWNLYYVIDNYTVYSFSTIENECYMCFESYSMNAVYLYGLYAEGTAKGDSVINLVIDKNEKIEPSVFALFHRWIERELHKSITIVYMSDLSSESKKDLERKWVKIY